MHNLRFKKLFLYLFISLFEGWGGESKTIFGGDTMPTARQISNIQGLNSRALHCSGFCPDNSDFLLCYVRIMISTLKKCFRAVAYQTWQMLLNRRT